MRVGSVRAGAAWGFGGRSRTRFEGLAPLRAVSSFAFYRGGQAELDFLVRLAVVFGSLKGDDEVPLAGIRCIPVPQGSLAVEVLHVWRVDSLNGNGSILF